MSNTSESGDTLYMFPYFTLLKKGMESLLRVYDYQLSSPRVLGWAFERGVLSVKTYLLKNANPSNYKSGQLPSLLSRLFSDSCVSISPNQTAEVLLTPHLPPPARCDAAELHLFLDGTADAHKLTAEVIAQLLDRKPLTTWGSAEFLSVKDPRVPNFILSLAGDDAASVAHELALRMETLLDRSRIGMPIEILYSKRNPYDFSYVFSPGAFAARTAELYSRLFQTVRMHGILHISDYLEAADRLEEAFRQRSQDPSKS